jgi:hypothetical protein
MIMDNERADFRAELGRSACGASRSRRKQPSPRSIRPPRSRLWATRVWIPESVGACAPNRYNVTLAAEGAN